MQTASNPRAQRPCFRKVKWYTQPAAARPAVRLAMAAAPAAVPHVHAHARHNPALVNTPEYQLLSRVANAAEAAMQQAQQRRASNAGASSSAAATGSSQQQPRCSAAGQLVDEVYEALEEVFHSKRGYIIPKKEAALINATGGSSTYGELLPEGVDRLLHILDMDERSVFLDAGCGTGQALLQVALQAPQVARAVGIELSASRLEHAELAADTLKELGKPLAPLELRCEDLSDADLSFATHVYFCSTAYSAGLCRSIAKRLARSPNFNVLVTSRALPVQPYLTRVGELPLPYSFTLAGLGYVYVKAAAFVGAATEPAGQPPVDVLARFWSEGGVFYFPGAGVPRLAVAVEDPLQVPGRGASGIRVQTGGGVLWGQEDAGQAAGQGQ